MADITIRVRDKIAQPVGDPTIVCGNDGYNVVLDLDSEWDDYEIKTMRVAWVDTFSGQPRHIDVPYILNFAALPVIADAYEVQIGVYAGNIKTSTPAAVPCERCITDGGTYHEDPEPQTYAALLELLRSLGGGGATVGDATFWIPDAINLGSVGDAEIPETVIDILSEPYSSSLVNGYVRDNNTSDPQGVVVTPYPTRVVCGEFITIPDGAFSVSIDFEVINTAGQWIIYLYDSNGNFLKDATHASDSIAGVPYTTYINSGQFRSIPLGTAAKFRIQARAADASANVPIENITKFKCRFR